MTTHVEGKQHPCGGRKACGSRGGHPLNACLLHPLLGDCHLWKYTKLGKKITLICCYHLCYAPLVTEAADHHVLHLDRQVTSVRLAGFPRQSCPTPPSTGARTRLGKVEWCGSPLFDNLENRVYGSLDARSHFWVAAI